MTSFTFFLLLYNIKQVQTIRVACDLFDILCKQTRKCGMHGPYFPKKVTTKKTTRFPVSNMREVFHQIFRRRDREELKLSGVFLGGVVTRVTSQLLQGLT